MPLAAALRAGAAGLDKALAVALVTGITPGNIQAHHAAADRRPEGNVDLIFEIGSGLGTFLRGPATAAENSGKNIAEAARARGAGLSPPGVFEHVGEVEAAEIEVCARRASTRRSSRESCAGAGRAASGPGICLGRCGIDVVGVKADLVVNLALLGIAQDFVSFGQRLELLFRGLVPGIDVGMILARKLAEGLADIVRRGGLLHAQDLVIVFFRGGGHSCLCAVLAACENSVLDIMTVLSQNAETLVRRRIHIDRNALHSSQRGRQDIPVGFVFREIQKIILTIHFKLQFVFSLNLYPLNP